VRLDPLVKRLSKQRAVVIVMIISSKSAVRNVSAVGFALLFPGFLVYHTLLSLRLIPPFIGGGFGPTAASLAVLYVILLPKITPMLTREVGWYLLWVVALLVYVTLWTVAHFFIGSASRTAAVQSIETAILWFVLFFVGCLLPFESQKLSRLFFLCFWLMVGYLAFFVISTGDLMFYARQQAAEGSETAVATYQGFARSALVINIFLLAVRKSIRERVAILTLGIFSLFVLGARSELYAFISAALVLLGVWALKSTKYKIIFVLLIFASGLVGGSMLDKLAPSRQLQVLDLDSSSSWMARKELKSRAMTNIYSNPVFGSFGAHVSDDGSTGEYAHNFLSAWANYGVIGLFLYVGITAWALLGAGAKVLFYRSENPVWTMALAMSFISLLLMAVSKSVFWPVPALAWGVYAQAVWSTKQLHSS